MKFKKDQEIVIAYTITEERRWSGLMADLPADVQRAIIGHQVDPDDSEEDNLLAAVDGVLWYLDTGSEIDDQSHGANEVELIG